MKKTMAIYDSEECYVTRFMEYFNNKSNFEFELSGFTLEESLLSYLSQHKVEILLLAAPVPIDGTVRDHVGFIYELSEENHSASDEERSVIFKYQSAQAVMDELRTDYIRRNKTTPSEEGSAATELITIFSPKAGMEELIFAWSTAFLFAKSKRTLFVPMELIPTHFLSFIDTSLEKLSEFIYYLKENPNIITKMNSLLQCHSNLCYLAGITHGFDLLSLSTEDIRKWVSELRFHSDFQHIVFYLDYYDAAGAELMKLSNRILLPTDHTIYHNKILKEWELQMERMGTPLKSDRYHYVNINQDPGCRKDYRSLQELTQSSTWYSALQYINST
jgi:hypothetical protein